MVTMKNVKYIDTPVETKEPITQKPKWSNSGLFNHQEFKDGKPCSFWIGGNVIKLENTINTTKKVGISIGEGNGLRFFSRDDLTNLKNMMEEMLVQLT